MAEYGLKEAPQLSKRRIEELLVFSRENGLEYADLSLLDTALTHSSFANENSNIKDYERLEFLGDSVISLIVSKWLYQNLKVDEGECTRIRAYIVSEASLSKIAKKLNLQKYLLIGKGEELTGGRDKKAILCDIMEAVTASIYLDQGFAKAESFILNLLEQDITDFLTTSNHKDYKTLLQEYVQKRYKKVPTYELVCTKGPDHDQSFYYKVSFNGHEYGPCEGHNKKDSEQAVARLAYNSIKNINN